MNMGPKMRCKMTVQTVSRDNDGGASIVLLPVTSGSDENKQFWKYTPSGRLELQVLNHSAVEGVAEGQSYYVDLTLAEDARQQ
jgi:hypothetical protein